MGPCNLAARGKTEVLNGVIGRIMQRVSSPDNVPHQRNDKMTIASGKWRIIPIVRTRGSHKQLTRQPSRSRRPPFATCSSRDALRPVSRYSLGLRMASRAAGTWHEIYSNATGGQSGSGKINTLLSLIAQSLLQDIRFWIVDYHWPHDESLLAKLEPLRDTAALRQQPDGRAPAAGRRVGVSGSTASETGTLHADSRAVH